jgi:hypothetical protein
MPWFAACLAILVTIAAGSPILGALRRRKPGKSYVGDEPTADAAKAGTPTMGGLIVHLLAPRGRTEAAALGGMLARRAVRAQRLKRWEVHAMRPFGMPSTSRWTGAAIIVQFCRTKTCIVTGPSASRRPMASSLAG